MSNNKILK